MADAPANVRPAAAGDLAEVARIFAHYVSGSAFTFEEDPPTVSKWHQRLISLAERRLPFLVAEADGMVTGYAYAAPWRPTPAYQRTVEDSVYLAPAWRGRGQGRALLQALLTECAATGVCQVIAVIADTGDPASEALHRRCGFTDAGRLTRVGFKHGRWIDTVLLQRAVGRPREDDRSA
jgi:L-amino acid N-acyltransferase YncA